MPRPIVVPIQEWERIKQWTGGPKEDPEAARVREYVARLQQASAQITKQWPNSLENVNKRNEEMRRARQQAAEEVNAKFYRRYLKRKQEEAQSMLHSARDAIFKSSDAPKLLLSGVIESVILKEREEQIKFDKQYIQAPKLEEQRKHDEEVLQKAREWQKLQKEKKKKRFEVNKQHQKELLEQADEVLGRRRREKEEELTMQQRDLQGMQQEIELHTKFQQELKAKEKARIWKDNTESIRQIEEKRQQKINQEKMDEKLMEVIKQSQARIERQRRDTQKRLQAERQAVVEALGRRLDDKRAATEATNQAILNKAVEEKTKAIEARHLADLAKTERQARERKQLHEELLREQEERQQAELTMRRFSLINRYKNAEIYEDYKRQKREEEEAKKKQYREEILKQQKEREEREARAREETRQFYGEYTRKKFREQDNKVLSLAAELLEEARAKGRPTRPIEKAIHRYCSHYRLYPLPDLPRSMKEHFPQYKPWDGTKVDPHFLPVPKPPQPKSMFDTDGDEPEKDKGPKSPEPQLERTDGLQDIFKAEAERSRAKAPVPEVEEFARRGPANGLQRRNALTEPPWQMEAPPEIREPQCKTHDCECDIKGQN